MKTKLQILSIRIEQKVDESPDLSFIGEYTDEPKDGAIIRATGEVIQAGVVPEFPEKSREHRFFIPAMTGEQTGNPNSPKEDYARMESYNRGEWQMLGIIAKATIRNPQTGCVQTIHSGGLWGIESDSGDYLKEVAREQLAELKTELLALSGGLGERAIKYAIKNCKL